jgi:CO dehydrogenase/acetyl-CoA synthase beta subunit
MDLFERQLNELNYYIGIKKSGAQYKEHIHSTETLWPSGMKRNVVLGGDMAVELGNPRDESVSFLIWTDDEMKVNSGRITVIGPDIPESRGQSIPFGKIIIARVNGFTPENSYDRYREMDMSRFDIDLKGYMIRAVPQHGREWSRISKEAVDGGFSFPILGGAVMDRLNKFEYVSAAEVIFVTSSKEDVAGLRAISESAMKITGAMNKMAAELSIDCDSCDFQSVCDEVDDLRKMRDSLAKRSGGSGTH